jgi:hypothetical protein
MNVIFNASLLYRHFFFSWMVWFIVFNATFNNISVISWRSVFLVVETGVPEENPLSHVTDNFYHIMLYRTGVELTTLVVIGTDCTGSCKSNYHTKTTTTAPVLVDIDGICNNHCSLHNFLYNTWHCKLYICKCQLDINHVTLITHFNQFCGIVVSGVSTFLWLFILYFNAWLHYQISLLSLDFVEIVIKLLISNPSKIYRNTKLCFFYLL